MNAIIPLIQPRNRSAARRRTDRLHDEAAGGIAEAVCAIVLVSCLITAFGQCIAQIVA